MKHETGTQTELDERVFLLSFLNVAEIDLPSFEIRFLIAPPVTALELTLTDYYFVLRSPPESHLRCKTSIVTRSKWTKLRVTTLFFL